MCWPPVTAVINSTFRSAGIAALTQNVDDYAGFVSVSVVRQGCQDNNRKTDFCWCRMPTTTVTWTTALTTPSAKTLPPLSKMSQTVLSH